MLRAKKFILQKNSKEWKLRKIIDVKECIRKQSWNSSPYKDSKAP